MKKLIQTITLGAIAVLLFLILSASVFNLPTFNVRGGLVGTFIGIWPNGWLLLGLGGMLALVLLIATHFIGKLSAKSFWQVMALVAAMTVTIQVLLLLTFEVKMETDVGYVVLQALSLAHGDPSWYEYFEFMGNNTNITLWYALLTKIVSVVPTSLVMNFVQVMVLDLSIVFLFNVFRRFINQKSAFLLAMLAACFTPFTLFNLVPYSDEWVLPGVLVVIGLVIKQQYQSYSWKSTLLLGLAFGWIFALKPNTITFILAFVIYFWIIQKGTAKTQIKSMAKKFAVLGLGFLAVMGLFAAGTKVTHAPLDSGRQLSVANYILMGNNVNTSGQYENDDHWGGSARGWEKVSELKTRLKTFIKENRLLTHWYDKLSVQFSRGMMDTDDTRSYYRNSERSPMTALYKLAYLQQVLYVAILLLAAGLVIRIILTHHFTPEVLFVSLAMLGYASFHVLFWEVEGRYGMIWVPFLLTFVAVNVADVQLVGKTSWAAMGGVTTILAVIGLFLSQNLYQKIDVTHTAASQRALAYSDQSVITLQPNQSFSEKVKVTSDFSVFNTTMRGDFPPFTLILSGPDYQHSQVINQSSRPTANHNGEIGFKGQKGIYTITIKNHTKKEQTYAHMALNSPYAPLSDWPIEGTSKYLTYAFVTHDQEQIMTPIQLWSSAFATLLVGWIGIAIIVRKH